MSDRTLVVLQRGTMFTFRKPTADERKRWGDAWVCDAHIGGRHLGTWPGDRYVFTVK